jgi:hypothetical protein
MGYLPKQLLYKAYLTLSTLTEDHKQGQTQLTSALRHLLAFDMFYKKQEEDCDLDSADNRDSFVNNVRDIVNVAGDYYTTNFYTNIKELADCGVGSNFYSAGVVNNSKQNSHYTYDYPTRGQYPLFKVKDNKLIREVSYYKNVRGYLNNQNLKCAFVIWLLRKHIIWDLDATSIRKKLQSIFTEELVSAIMPKEENLNEYLTGFTLDNNLSPLSVNDLLGLFSDKTSGFISDINPKYRVFIVAIKSKPFLLLAGISGTGKSRIVRELARACWDEESEEYKAQKPRNLEMIQVKPNWHDSSELIGYVSRVSGRPVFVAGEFLKFVTRAWEEKDVPYFLCLDEMNLAPVEQYFAEYLSVVESRKAGADGSITTDPILKKNKDDWYRILTSELTEDDEVRDRYLKDGICIPENLIVVGTVNMDETTFSFSRKVLDRAMTIEMNEVDLKGGLETRFEKIGKLGTAKLIGTAVEGVDVYGKYKDVCDTAIDYLQKINDVLEGTPFKIAYRTRNEVLLYVVNNLPYNSDEIGDNFKQEYIIARALDEITKMKILSRIEGDESKVSARFLEELGNAIKEGLDAIFKGPFGIEDKDDTYKSHSLAKLDEMKRRLNSGYTSFWS